MIPITRANAQKYMDGNMQGTLITIGASPSQIAIDNTDLAQNSLTVSVNGISGDEFELGTTPSRELEFSVFDGNSSYGTIKSGDSVTLSISIVGGSSISYGSFVISEVRRADGKYTFKAVDKMYSFDATVTTAFKDWLRGYSTSQNLLSVIGLFNKICTVCNVNKYSIYSSDDHHSNSVPTYLPNTTSPHDFLGSVLANKIDDDTTYRDILRTLGEYVGGFCLIDCSGYCCIRGFRQASYSSQSAQYFFPVVISPRERFSSNVYNTGITKRVKYVNKDKDNPDKDFIYNINDPSSQEVEECTTIDHNTLFYIQSISGTGQQPPTELGNMTNFLFGNTCKFFDTSVIPMPFIEPYDTLVYAKSGEIMCNLYSSTYTALFPTIGTNDYYYSGTLNGWTKNGTEGISLTLYGLSYKTGYTPQPNDTLSIKVTEDADHNLHANIIKHTHDNIIVGVRNVGFHLNGEVSFT